MAARKSYQRFVDLPQGIQNFFMDAVDTTYDGLLKDYALPADKLFEDLEEPILMCALGAKTVAQTMAALDANFQKNGLAPDRAKGASDKLLKSVFWPLRDLFGEELTVYLTEHKIETQEWPPERVLFRPLSYSGLASEVVNRLRLYSLGQQARTQLRQLVADYATLKSVPSQLKEAMMRAPDFGGLGFDEKTADKALAVLQAVKDSGLEILSEEAYGEYLTAQTSKLAASLRQPDGQEASEQEEIASIRAAQPPPVPRIATELDKAVEAAVAAIADKPKDEYLLGRLSNVVSSRLRDVRNAGELVSLLQRDSKVGGMGLDREKAAAWSATVENVYKEYRGKIEAEEKNKLETQLAEQKRKIEDRRRQESEAHAQWYQEKIKSRQAQEQEKEKIAAAIKKGMQTTAAPVEQKAVAAEKRELGELVPAPAATAKFQGVAKPEAPQKNPTGTSGPAVAPAVPVAPMAPPTVRVSAATAAMAAKNATAPTPVDGVRPMAGAPRLQGLVGELGALSLAQFRRLGKTPAEATAKLLQRLDTLKEESFENRMEGIRSWQQSPVMKGYLDLVTKSFKAGKPIAQVAEMERAAGHDSLSREEIEALIQMNNQLHF